jgi:hypothetical protein
MVRKKPVIPETSIDLPAIHVNGVTYKSIFHGAVRVEGKRNLFLVVPWDVLTRDSWKKTNVPTYIPGFRVKNIPETYKKYLVKYNPKAKPVLPVHPKVKRR